MSVSNCLRDDDLQASGKHASTCASFTRSARTRRAASKLQPRFNTIASSVLRKAVTEGPVFLLDLDKAHEHVLRPDARAFAE